MTKREMKKLTRDEIIDLSVKQARAIDAIRGYFSGMERRHFAILDTDTLIDCFMQNEKAFGLCTR